MPAPDCVALTVLTSLTKLRLAGMEAAGDSTAVALARSLKQLRHLHIESRSLGSFACTAAVSHLSGLSHLGFCEYGRFGRDCGLKMPQLMLLTALPQLQQLVVVGLKPDSVDRFWAAHRQRWGAVAAMQARGEQCAYGRLF
jgi:hypothetical protein